METISYENENRVEEKHWWFIGRRLLFGKVVLKLKLPKSSAILDIGSSTGANLRLLTKMGYTEVQGLDPSPLAIEFCHQKGLARVSLGDARELPFEDASLDLILATDIIEHVEEDKKVIDEIFRTLKPGGHALFTVPAFQCLWGNQDELYQHKRRYLKRNFNELVTSSGMRIKKTFYFNYLLFFPIWITRQIIKWVGISDRSELDTNSKSINAVFLKIFKFDVLSAPYLKPPFGVSILTLASKPNVEK